MAERKKRRMMTIAEIQAEYLDMDYKKIKKFLVTTFPYKQIGRVFYFNQEDIDKWIENGKQEHYKLGYY